MGGVGYRVRAHTGILGSLKIDLETRLFIHEHVREDAYDLFGFSSRDELDFFESLLSVSGVGPKVALVVCSSEPLESLKIRLMKGDVDWLSSLSGIGKKTAQKIILELKGQLVEVGMITGPDAEVAQALISLGYSSAQAKEAVKNIPIDITDSSERIRAALRQLGK